MVQPAARKPRKTPLSNGQFRERATTNPPIRWANKRIPVKLAILSREKKTLDTLFDPKPTHVRLPPEPNYQTPIEDATEKAERV